MDFNPDDFETHPAPNRVISANKSTMSLNQSAMMNRSDFENNSEQNIQQGIEEFDLPPQMATHNTRVDQNMLSEIFPSQMDSPHQSQVQQSAKPGQNEQKAVVIKATSQQLRIFLIITGILFLAAVGVLIYYVIPKPGNSSPTAAPKPSVLQITENQKTFQKEVNVLSRTFLPNHTYTYSSKFQSVFNQNPSNYTQQFGLMCIDYDSVGWNMIFYVQSFTSSGSTFNYSDNYVQIKKGMDEAKVMRNMRRHLQSEEDTDNVPDSDFIGGFNESVASDQMSAAQTTFNMKNDTEGVSDIPININGNENDYADQPYDADYQPSFETEITSSLSILEFKLTYSGKIGNITFGIGLEDDQFTILRKLLVQIFPLVDKQSYNNTNSQEKSVNPDFSSLGIFNTSRTIKTLPENQVQLQKISLLGDSNSRQEVNLTEINVFNALADLQKSIIQSYSISRNPKDSSDTSQPILDETSTYVRQEINLLNITEFQELDKIVKEIIDKKVMTTLAYDFEQLEKEIVPMMERVEKYKSYEPPENKTDCWNPTTARNLQQVDPKKLIMKVEPVPIIDFDILSQKCGIFIESNCYATEIGKQDVCVVELFTKVIGMKIPIMPKQSVNCHISQLAKKFQFFRNKIMNKIDFVNDVLLAEVKNLGNDLAAALQSLQNLVDPNKYDIFVTVRDLIRNFEKTINEAFDNSIGVVNSVAGDIINFLEGPIQTIQIKMEDYAVKNANELEFLFWNRLNGCKYLLNQINMKVAKSTQVSDVDIQALANVKRMCQNYQIQLDASFTAYNTFYYENIHTNVQNINTHIINQLSDLLGLPAQLKSVWDKLAENIATVLSAKDLEKFDLELLDLVKSTVTYYQNLGSNQFTTVIQGIDTTIKTVNAMTLSSQSWTTEYLTISSFISAADFHNNGEIDQLSQQFFTAEINNIQTYLSNFLKSQFQTYFQDLINQLRDMPKNLKETLTTNITNLRAQITGLGSSLTNSVTQFKSNINDIKTQFGTNVVESVKNIIEAVQTLFTAKDEENTDLKNSVVTVDYKDIEVFKDKLLLIFDNAKSIKTQFQDLMKVNDFFKPMEDYLKEFKKLPARWVAISKRFAAGLQFQKLRDIQLPYDFTDIQNLFTSNQQNVNNDIDSGVISQVKTQGFTVLTNFIGSFKDNFMSNVKSDFLKSFLDVSKNNISPFLKNIISEFVSITRTLFDKTFKQGKEYQYYFPTPVGYPVQVTLFFAFGAQVKLDFGIQGRSVEIQGNAGLFVTVGATGAFAIPRVIEIGVIGEVKGEVGIRAQFGTGLENQFYYKVLVDAYFDPLNINLGLYYRHITLKKICPLNRRELRDLTANNTALATTIYNRVTFFKRVQKVNKILDTLDECGNEEIYNDLKQFLKDVQRMQRRRILNVSKHRLLGLFSKIKSAFQKVVQAVVQVVKKYLCIYIPDMSERKYILGPFSKSLIPKMYQKFVDIDSRK